MKALRVVSFESRRAAEMARLIAARGGIPISAPALREVPLEHNAAALEFGGDLVDGRYGMVIFLTGVGARGLLELIEKQYRQEQIVEALARLCVVVRGPKPAGVLREWGVPIAVAVPEPNTWRELVTELDARQNSVALAGLRVAIQEYGAPSMELVQALEQRGARVTVVPVYRWTLPEDLEPLRAAIRAIAAGEAEIALFTNAVQVTHLLEVAERERLSGELRAGLTRMVVASIGPTASGVLRENGLPVDIEPEHPHMGFLVKETAERAPELLARKRG